MQKVLLAGVTGYLGGYIAKELQERRYFVRAITRHLEKLKQQAIEPQEVIVAEVTQAESLTTCCTGIDVVISTIGITRQKEEFTYKEVDYQANVDLLQQAQKNGVKKFIYISVLNGEKLKQLKICEAKEQFVAQLKQSGLDYCVIRPNGFFSDMTAFYDMAKKGRIYLFGDGERRLNPIHGADLATVCVDAIEQSVQEINIGGPETFTQNEMAMIAFNSLGVAPKITYIPSWFRFIILKLLSLFTSSRFYGPVEFFLTVMALDMVAPEYGKQTLKAYFAALNRQTGR